MNRVTEKCKGCENLNTMGNSPSCMLAEKCKIRMYNGRDGEKYVKDTVYIRQDLYDAIETMASEYGMKKDFINEAIEDLIKKKMESV